MSSIQLNYFELPTHPMDNHIKYYTSKEEYLSWVEAYDRIMSSGEYTEQIECDLDLLLDVAYDSAVFNSTYGG